MDRSVAPLLVLILLTTLSTAILLPVNAVPKTIIVPDDYPSITAAIGNATAGDTIFVKKGTYEGPKDQTLVIDKSVSLVGEDAIGTIINLHPAYKEWWILTQQFFNYSDAIIIDANDVTLSNFTILPSPGGDVSATGDRIHIKDNTIGNAATSLSVSGSYNVISGNLASYYIHLDNVNSTKVINNTCFSLRLGFNGICSDSIISGNTVDGNKIRGPGYYGIHIKASTNNIFYNNYFSNLHGYGEGDEMAGWGVGFDYGCIAENNTFYHNVFIDNNYNVAFDENVTLIGNLWDNGKEGNYWDDYNGTDNNRDGIGDAPYIINGNNIDHYPLIAPYDIEKDTIVLPAPKSFPTALVIVSVITVAVISVGLLVYFKKRRK